MTKAAIDVQFEFAVESVGTDLSVLRKLIADTCRNAGIKEAAVSVCVVGDAEMTETHRQFLGKDGTTDVISFDLTDEFESRQSFAIVVNAQMAARQAKRRKHRPEAELALYITHGLLHQLGYDDHVDQDARSMHEREDAILTRYGFGQVYFNSTKETD